MVCSSPSNPRHVLLERGLNVTEAEMKAFLRDGDLCYQPYIVGHGAREARICNAWPLECDLTGVTCSLQGPVGAVVIEWMLARVGLVRADGWVYELVRLRDLTDLKWTSQRRPDIAIWRWRKDGEDAETVLLAEYKTGAAINGNASREYCPTGIHHHLPWSGQPLCYLTCIAKDTPPEVKFLWLCPERDIATPFKSAQGSTRYQSQHLEWRPVVEALDAAKDQWSIASIESLALELDTAGFREPAALLTLRLGLAKITDHAA